MSNTQSESSDFKKDELSLVSDTHSNDIDRLEILMNKINELTNIVNKILLLIEEDPSRIQNRIIRMGIPSPFFPHFMDLGRNKAP